MSDNYKKRGLFTNYRSEVFFKSKRIFYHKIKKNQYK